TLTMSVQEATQNDFRLVSTPAGNVLTINRHGNTLVFFKMDTCPGCEAFAPIFHNLSGSGGRINNFVMVNISRYRDIVSWSRNNTKTPIQNVPLIILYVDGKPYAIYKGKKTFQDVLSFINKSLENISPSQGFMQPPNYHQNAPSQQQRGMYGSGGYNHPPLAPE